MDFAKEYNFFEHFSQIYFVERNEIQYVLSSGLNKIPRKFIFTSYSYETRFDELFDKGHSWINMNLAGILNKKLFIIIEVPDYENNVPREFVAVKYSLPTRRISENDWNMKPFYEIVG